MKLATLSICLVFEEEIDRRLPCVRSLCLIREDIEISKLAKIYCFISKKVVFEQYMVMNGEPV